MSFQKFAASWLSAAQETNFGLATFHVDFSLIKVEAPAEFQTIGRELAMSRRQAAEEGDHHVIARKLGALFQHCLPSTPHLIKAYGHRATEIILAAGADSEPSTMKSIFADQAGVDATSLWAAATSGAAAISVHLLACLLARIWSPSQATAIWTELIQERKHELSSCDETHPSYHENLHISKLTITRDQLSVWDASARSWLRTADGVMSRKHAQLNHVINNTILPVNTKATLYQSVMHAWKRAMELTSDLISGQPQSIPDGSVLLGLSSWHLYPDMIVLSESSIPIVQDDRLVSSGGLLTIGLQIEVGGEHDGIFWSLPLGHLRYYGGPVISEGSLNISKGRVSPSSLMLVALGCMTSSWKFSNTDLASVLIRLWEYISTAAYRHDWTFFWLGHVAQGIEQLLSSDELLVQECQQLVRLGRKRSSDFLGTDLKIPPMFGLCDVPLFLSLIESTEDRISVLRNYVQELGDDDRIYLIRYRYGCSSIGSCGFEYATATSMGSPTLKRDNSGHQIKAKKYLRWVEDTAVAEASFQMSKDPSLSHSQAHLVARQKLLEPNGELVLPYAAESIKSRMTSRGSNIRWWNPHNIFESYSVDAIQPLVTATHEYKRYVDISWVIGDLNSIALFSVRQAKTYIPQRARPPLPGVGLNLLTRAIDTRILSPQKIVDHLFRFIVSHEQESFYMSMRALITLGEVYKMLPGATVELRATSSPLHLRAWVSGKDKEPDTNARTSQLGESICPLRPAPRWMSPAPMTRSRTFSCIALFESGVFDLDPYQLQDVMAMASGDSIYISAALLCDPSEVPKGYEIRRIRGSIGKPGMVMLIPPQQPMVRKMEEWRLVNHRPFDGRLENSFQATSLHLRFTDYQLPIHIGIHGVRGSEIYFLESCVSVHDKGTWVADLDVLKRLSGDLIKRHACTSSQQSCSHSSQSLSKIEALTSIDDWDEILDPPDGIGIIRARHNWLARLATAVLSSQLGHKTIVLPNEFCWDCVTESWGDYTINSDQEDEQVFFVC
ncbi:hypothetical protein RRF57_007672 [Xylaria bambusicola]|uniref:Uncharacterized protein n=1 Tax=Xylaria bambusicola TaxID=326684 RepID=A0AAN7ZAX4_9PEZI